MNIMLIIWISLFVAFILVEAATAQLVSIWFVAGTIFAMIAYGLKAEVWLQITVFVITSAIALIATRPLVKKLNKKEKEPMNADRVIGKSAVVTETIDNVAATGKVKLEGMDWTARSNDDTVINENEKVKVIRIQGVKLIVEKEN